MSDKQRDFTAGEHAAILRAASGKCQICGKTLGRKWHADHIIPHDKGGLTVVTNGQALCPDCNLKKGNKTMNTIPAWNRTLRQWQTVAVAKILDSIQTGKDRFTLVAFPGAGKTIVSLRVIYAWVLRGKDHIVVFVVPNRTLKNQLHEDADRNGLWLSNRGIVNGQIESGSHGIVLTYAKVDTSFADSDTQSQVINLCRNYKTLVVLDEVHHAGAENLNGRIKQWGESVKVAFENAAFKLVMSGTLWRSDSHTIPFVQYVDNQSVASGEYGFTYGYGDLLRDTAQALLNNDADNLSVRPLKFISMGGETEFLYGADNLRVDLNELLEREFVSPALRSALDPNVGTWFRNWFKEADKNLLYIRGNSDAAFPDAAGLVIASSKYHAEEYATIIEEMTGERPFVVHYEQDEPQEDIKRFKTQQDENGKPIPTPRWIVSVNMISEGTDIPRLAILFYATIVREKLYFYQAIGRVVRWYKNGPRRQLGLVYMPFIKPLTTFAEEIKQQMIHVITEHEEGPGPGPQQKLFASLFSIDKPGDIIIEDGRVEADYIGMARTIMNTMKTPMMTTEDLAETLQMLDLQGMLTLDKTVSPPQEQRKKTHGEEIRDVIQSITESKGVIAKLRYAVFKIEDRDKDIPAAAQAIYSYIEKDLGFGKSEMWGDRVFEIQAILNDWMRTRQIPIDLRNRFEYLRRRGA